MKSLMIIIDGLGDEKLKQLNYKTTFEYAQCKNIAKLASQGAYGHLEVCPQGHLPESMVCILRLLGVEEGYYPKGRAYLELLSRGQTIKTDQVVLRCNLVAVDKNNILSSFNGGTLSKELMKKAARKVTSTNQPLKFLHLSGYRNLLIMNKDDFTDIECLTYPPHEYMGEDISKLLSPITTASPVLEKFISSSAEVLNEFKDKGQRYLYYPWDISTKVKLPSFQELHDIKGAAVCSAEIVKGIAHTLDMYVPELPGVTADIDTSLITKAQRACQLLDDYDFVVVHINGADEAAHRKDYRQKIEFLERIDKELIAYLLENISFATKILICGDHCTSSLSGKHTKEPVPYIVGCLREKSMPSNLNSSIALEEILKYFFDRKAGGGKWNKA